MLRFPLELEKDITVLDYSLHPQKELEKSLERVLNSARAPGGLQVKLDGQAREKVLKTAQGLTCTECENVFARSTVAG